MPQRHSKNNNDLAFFTYDEKRKLGYGTQKERLGRDSIKPFDVCCLCLKPYIEPMSCLKGHVFCKECILECLLAQKKDIQSWHDNFPSIIEIDLTCRKQLAHATQQKQEKEEEEERLMLQKARELDVFDQQNHGAVPQYNDKNYNTDKNGFHGANSVKTTSYEEEALRTMKAFWLPSATPEAPKKVDAPSTETSCPEGSEKLRLKTLFPVKFTEDTSERRSTSLDKTYICPSCKVTLTNTLSLVALSSCGHVFCKKCADKFMAVDKVCLVCDRPCKERNLINLAKGGTGFAGHGDHLEAKDFKHLGSGSGLGLVRPAMKT
ncbi:E3 ubiquitin-protein ligase csu1 [Orobanche gracilis]